MENVKNINDTCLSDKQIVDGLLAGNNGVVQYFFYKKCSKVFEYIIDSVFDGNVEYDELVSELYIYISEDNWKKLKLFKYRSSLVTWVSVVATRFFIKKRNELIERESSEELMLKNDIAVSPVISRNENVQQALQSMPSERYKMVLYRLYFDNIKPVALAEEMGINVDNLYNIHRRALAQLKLHIGRKEDYYE